LALEHIILKPILMLSSIILFFSLWKLYRAYVRERSWSFSLIGIGLYAIGATINFMFDFNSKTSLVIDFMKNGFMALGMSVFTIGIMMIVRQLISMANTDPITGLYNNRFLYNILGHELKRAKRYGLPLSIIFIDLNNFKNVNDMMGHSIGDVVLRKVSEKLHESVRAIDFLARYGGDEFVVLMPHTDFSSSQIIVRRLQEAVCNLELPGDSRIGLSFGIAGYPEDGDNVNQLLNIADRRMYDNKSLQ
jgi:diguanylate cyclase (GGDEF)-like protein